MEMHSSDEMQSVVPERCVKQIILVGVLLEMIVHLCSVIKLYLAIGRLITVSQYTETHRDA